MWCIKCGIETIENEFHTISIPQGVFDFFEGEITCEGPFESCAPPEYNDDCWENIFLTENSNVDLI